MIKTPIDTEETTSISGKLIATPKENAEASGGEEQELIRPKPYVYTINGVDDIYINMDISNWTRTYSNFAAAKQEFGYPAAIAHETENGLVKVSYVAFERTGMVYYLKGRTSISYEENKEELKKAFGGEGVWQSYCTYGTYTGQEYSLNFSDDNITASTEKNGTVSVRGNDMSWYCTVTGSGKSACSD